MSTIEITVPETLKTFIDSEAAAAGHATPSECVVAMLKEVQKKRAWAKAEQLVLEGLQSGEPIPMDDAFWAEMHRGLRERYPEVDNP